MPSVTQPAANHMVLYRVQTPTLQTTCVDALTWLGRPGLAAGSLDRHDGHFVVITCTDATADVLAEGFILGIDPFAKRVGQRGTDRGVAAIG